MPFLNVEPKPKSNPRGTPQTLIRDPQLRLQIHAQKQAKILHWLKTEIYSSPEILALVLGLAHRQSMHKVLVAMQDQGLIRQVKVPVVGGHQMQTPPKGPARLLLLMHRYQELICRKMATTHQEYDPRQRKQDQRSYSIYPKRASMMYSRIS